MQRKLTREGMINSHRAALSCAEFNGERIVEHHMERMGGKEQLLEQMYSAMATQRDETVNLALRSYGAPLPSLCRGQPQSCPSVATAGSSPTLGCCWLSRCPSEKAEILCAKCDARHLAAQWRSDSTQTFR